MSPSELPSPADRPPYAELLRAPPTRREVFLFGLLLLAIMWAFASAGPRTVIVVPDNRAAAGVIT